MGHQLVRVNLILTGIMFKGSIEDEITFHGPSLVNECLKKGKEDIKKLILRIKKFLILPLPTSQFSQAGSMWVSYLT